MKRPLLCSVCLLLIPTLGPAWGLQSNLAKAQDTETASDGLKIAKLNGELESISRSPFGLKIKSEDGESHIAILANQTLLEYRGTADARFLQPGLFVRFVAPFYPQTLAPQAPVTAIEVFREEKKRRPSREEMQSQTPGIYPVQEQKGGKPKEDAIAPAPAGMKNFQVVGQIMAIQADRIRVQAGNNFVVLAQIDPAAIVSVASGDTFFCVPGDKVEVTGLRNDLQANLLQAESVKITGSKPLGSPLEEQPQNEKPSRRSRLNRDKK